MDLDALERGEGGGHCWGWLNEAFIIWEFECFYSQYFSYSIVYLFCFNDGAERNYFSLSKDTYEDYDLSVMSVPYRVRDAWTCHD